MIFGRSLALSLLQRAEDRVLILNNFARNDSYQKVRQTPICMKFALGKHRANDTINIMNSTVKFPIRAIALAACLAGAGGNGLWAGEAIIFGNSKERLEPGKENKAETGLFGKSLGSGANTDPLQSITPTLLPNIQPRNSRQELRRQNEADEKANWLLVNEGELTKKDETFGVDDRRYSAEGLEKEDKSRNYTFRSMNNGGGKPGMKNGKPNTELLRQVQQSRRENGDSEAPLQASKDPIGLKTSSALDFQKLLNPEKSDNGVLGFSKSDFSLKDLFNNPSPAMSDRLQESHAAKFNDFLNGPAVANSSESFRGSAGAYRSGGSGLDFTPGGGVSTPAFPTATPGMVVPSFVSPAAGQNFGQANPFSTPASREPTRSSSQPAPKEFPRRSF
jgi:hypothetical protein